MHTKNLKCLCRPSSEIFREERTGKKGEIGSYIRQVELEVLQLGTTTTLKPRNIFRLFCNNWSNHVWCLMSVCSKLKIVCLNSIDKSSMRSGLFNALFKKYSDRSYHVQYSTSVCSKPKIRCSSSITKR